MTKYFNVMTLRGIGTNAKLVLLFLINEDNATFKNNVIVAILDYIKQMTGLSRRTIQRSIKSLINSGLLGREKIQLHSNDNRYTYVYSVNYPLLDTLLGFNNVIDKEF